MTKPLHVGHTARNGLFAALMVQQGFTANPGALEAKQGFLEVFNGPGTYNIDRILADWYAPLEVEGGEPGLKPYPCCGSTHASINRMIHLARTHDLKPADIASIEIMPPAAHQQPRPAHAASGDIQHPVRHEELWEKFQDCARRALPRANIAPLFERLSNIDTIGTVGELTALLQRHAAAKAAE